MLLFVTNLYDIALAIDPRVTKMHPSSVLFLYTKARAWHGVLPFLPISWHAPYLTLDHALPG